MVPNVFSRWLVVARMIVPIALLVAGPLGAQTYQSSFSEVKFDRTKGPATFAAGIQVDAASGAVSMEVPFGPGIGERGLRFRPLLSMRLSPQVSISSTLERNITSYLGETPLYLTNSVDTLYERASGSASFSPGTFDLSMPGGGTTLSNYSLPGGGGGTMHGEVPSGMGPAEARSLLTRFGVAGDISRMSGQADNNGGLFIRIGSSGHLIIGLANPGNNIFGTDEVQTWSDESLTGSLIGQQRMPRRILVVAGDLAYEFSYTSHKYISKYVPYITYSSRTPLIGGHYVITRMMNRFGESIGFTYDPDGVGYTATWSTNNAVKIRVQAQPGNLPTPSMPLLGRSDFSMNPPKRIVVSYQGLSKPVSTYHLDVATTQNGGTLTGASIGGPTSSLSLAVNGWPMKDDSWGSEIANLQPVSVVQEETQESIAFWYTKGVPVTWDSFTVQPTVLYRVTYPTREVSLTWKPYKYQPNYEPNAWGPLPGSRKRPSFAYGVTEIADTADGVTRKTVHDRTVPQMNWGTDAASCDAPGSEYWVSTSFHTAITQPDGQVVVHRFVEPDTSGGTAAGAYMRTLGYLKHIEREVRFYEPGAAWASDLATTSPSGTSAYKVVLKDRLELRSTPDVSGTADRYSTPYPTRTRTWDRDSRTLVTEEMDGWSPSQYAWTLSHRTTAISPSFTLDFDLLGLAQNGRSYASPGATMGTETLTTKAFSNLVGEWLFGRVTSESQARSQDNTGLSVATGGPAPITRTYHQTLNTLLSQVSGDPATLGVTTTLEHAGESGLDGYKLNKAFLSSDQDSASGNRVGVSAYGYDSNGFINSITVKPSGTSTLTYRQDQDEIGRPTGQYDPDQRKTTIDWDSAGRLASILPPGGDVGMTITYSDSDHRGVQVTRGDQWTEYRFNGFGELILERRRTVGGDYSHKVYGRDIMGRQTGESVWLSGMGADDEARWMIPNLVLEVVQTVTIPGTSVCKKWGPADPETGTRECLQWQTTPETTVTTTLPRLYPGSGVSLDARGRVIKALTPVGIKTVTSYPVGDGFQKQVTVGDTQTTRFQYDSEGRLKAVIDAKGQQTRYGYDASNRISVVQQSDLRGHTQVRTWAYNALGWLASLSQPESGVTTYASWTLMGKPRATSYNGRSVVTDYDDLGRPTALRFDGSGVNSQTFTYDPAGGRGKLLASTDGDILTTYGYNTGTGRLESLVTTVGGESFTQTFGHDGYGNRTSGTTSHSGWTQSYHTVLGLPNILLRGSTIVASMPAPNYDAVSGQPTGIDYGNGAYSRFTYDADQARFASIKHFGASNTSLESWEYGYDGIGRIKEVRDLQLGVSDTFGYDELDRLTAAVIRSQTYGEQHQSFDYDGFGNRILSQTTSPGTVPSNLINVSFSPDDPALFQSNRLPATGTNGADTGASYDFQGNLTQVFEAPGASGRSISLTYDALARVVVMEQPGRNYAEVYQYRADGLRTLIHEYQGTVLQKSRLQIYNDARQLVCQYERVPGGPWTWERDILYLGTREAGEFDANGLHVTQVDHLGSPRVVTGPTGALEGRQKFMPFGELLESSMAYKTAKGYTNHEQTDISGLIYMQARFYLPMYGRFASPDPARDQHFELTQSWNIYSYVRNNPVTGIDPTGLLAGETPKMPSGNTEINTDGTSPSATSATVVGGENTDLEASVAKKKEASQTEKPGVVDRLVQGLDKEGAAKEVRDPANGSVSEAAYGKAHIGVTGAELSGGVAKTDQVGLAGPDGKLKFQAHGTEGSLAIGMIPTTTTKTTGPGKTEQQTTLVPKLSAQISIFKAGIGLKLGNKVYSIGLTAGAGLKMAPGKFELGALIYFSADAVK